MHNPNNAPLSVFTGCPGWESVPEQYTLHAQASIVPEHGVIVEIGSEFGMSASIFCMAADHTVEIFSIDLFPGDLGKQHRANLVEAGFGEKLPAGYVMRNTPLQGDSYEMGQHWRVTATHHGRNGHMIDLLFIDGDHSYNGVVRDIAAWTPHVKVGGVIIFHDAAPETNRNPHPLHYEVQRAIDEWVSPAWLEQPSCDSMRIFIRQR
jgi:predicted O-methyltransferase YrrM